MKSSLIFLFRVFNFFFLTGSTTSSSIVGSRGLFLFMFVDKCLVLSGLSRVPRSFFRRRRVTSFFSSNGCLFHKDHSCRMNSVVLCRYSFLLSTVQ